METIEVFLPFVLCNLLTGIVYLAFLKRPIKTRFQFALPSFIFVAIPIVAVAILWIGAPYLSQVRPAAYGVMAVLGIIYLAAAGFAIANALRILTWLNVIQTINIAAGALLYFLTYFVFMGVLFG